MNLKLSCYYSVEDVVQEPVQIDIDDEWIEFLLMHYLKQNKGTAAQLEDFVINSVCLD